MLLCKVEMTCSSEVRTWHIWAGTPQDAVAILMIKLSDDLKDFDPEVGVTIRVVSVQESTRT
jgi:hypothetical protein